MLKTYQGLSRAYGKNIWKFYTSLQHKLAVGDRRIFGYETEGLG